MRGKVEPIRAWPKRKNMPRPKQRPRIEAQIEDLGDISGIRCW